MTSKKKMLMTIVASLFAITLYAGTASAVVTCDAASIGKVGVFPDQPNKYRVELTCTDATPPWSGVRTFYLTDDPDGLGDSGYATVLTAISLNKTIKAVLADASWNSLVLQIFMNNI